MTDELYSDEKDVGIKEGLDLHLGKEKRAKARYGVSLLRSKQQFRG